MTVLTPPTRGVLINGIGYTWHTHTGAYYAT